MKITQVKLKTKSGKTVTRYHARDRSNGHVISVLGHTRMYAINRALTAIFKPFN